MSKVHQLQTHGKVLKMPKPLMSDWPRILYDLGVSYHDTGTITMDNRKHFDYYKVDSITPEQKEKITNIQSDVQFKSLATVYAPELTKLIICIPKAAYYQTKETNQ